MLSNISASISNCQHNTAQRLYTKETAESAPKRSPVKRVTRSSASALRNRTALLDKENVPLEENARTRFGEADKREHGKLCKKISTKGTQPSRARMPLRQLSKEEVFERDEAVIGDRRRRISGESLVVEFESTLTPTTRPLNRLGKNNLRVQVGKASVPQHAADFQGKAPSRARPQKIEVFREPTELLDDTFKDCASESIEKTIQQESKLSADVYTGSERSSNLKKTALPVKDISHSKPVITLSEKAAPAKLLPSRNTLRRTTRRL